MDKNPKEDLYSTFNRLYGGVPDSTLTDDTALSTPTKITGETLNLYKTAKEKYGEFNPVNIDPSEVLGYNQSLPDKWANAIGKTAGKLGTSFVNTTVGLLSSLGSGVYGALDNNPNTTFLTGFSQDPLTKSMNDLDNWMEQALPNYQTEERRDNEWYKNLGTADFWADGVLKNLGFAAGTFLGTAATMGLGDLALAKNGISKGLNLFAKAAVADASQGINYAKTGSGLGYLGSTAARIASGATKLPGLSRNLTASSIAAVSESKIEARQTYDEVYGDLISQGYNEQEADRIAKTAGNVDFVGNMALLLASNSAQFKGVFSKGNTLNNSLKKGAKSYIGNFETGFTKTKPAFFSKLVNGAKTIGKYSGGALREGLEEWGQYKINKLSKTYAERSSDSNAMLDVSALLDSAITVASETFQNPEGKTWLGGEAAENFAIGALLGGVGLPNIQKQDGRWKAEMAGGIFEARKDIKQEQIIGEEAGKKLQELYTKYGKDSKMKEFVAKLSYATAIQDAYKKGDISTAKGLEAQELASDYITALELGKEKEFLDLLDVTATPEEIRDFNKTLNKDGSTTIPEDLTDAQLEEQVIKNKQSVKQYIKQIDSIWNTVKPLQNVIGQEGDKSLAIQMASLEEVQDRMSKVIAEVNPLLTDILYNWEEEIPEIQQIKEFFGTKLSATNMPKTLFNIASQKDAYNKVKDLAVVLDKAVEKNAITPDKAEKLLMAYNDLIDLSAYRTQTLDLYKAALQGAESFGKYLESIKQDEKTTTEELTKDRFLSKINEYHDVTSLDSIEEPIYVHDNNKKETYVLQTIDGKPTLIDSKGNPVEVTAQYLLDNPTLDILPNKEVYDRLTELYTKVKKESLESEVPDVTTNDVPPPEEGGEVDNDIYLTPEEVSKANKSAKVTIDINYQKTAGQESSEKGLNQDPDQQRWYDFINNTPLKTLINDYKLQVVTPENNIYKIPFYQEAKQFQDNLDDNTALDNNILSTQVLVVNKLTGEPILDDKGLMVFTSLHELTWDKFSYPEFKDNKTKQELALNQARNRYKAFQKVVLNTYAKGAIPYVQIEGRSKGILETDVKNIPQQALGFTPINTPLEVFTGKTEAETMIGDARIMAKPGNIYSHTTLGDPVVMFKNTLSPTHQETAYQLIKGILDNTKETIKGLSYRQALEELVYVGSNSKNPKFDLFFTKKGAVKIGENYYESSEQLEQSKEQILQDLSLKVYNVINKLLDSNVSYESVTIQDDKLTTINFPSYKDYLLGSNRPVFEIPLLAKAPILGEGIKALNRYLTFDFNITSTSEEQTIITNVEQTTEEQILESKVSNPLILEYKGLKNKVNPRAKSRGNQVILELSKQFDEKYPNFVDNLLETNTDFDRICT